MGCKRDRRRQGNRKSAASSEDTLEGAGAGSHASPLSQLAKSNLANQITSEDYLDPGLGELCECDPPIQAYPFQL